METGVAAGRSHSTSGSHRASPSRAIGTRSAQTSTSTPSRACGAHTRNVVTAPRLTPRCGPLRGSWAETAQRTITPDPKGDREASRALVQSAGGPRHRGPRRVRSGYAGQCPRRGRTRPVVPAATGSWRPRAPRRRRATRAARNTTRFVVAGRARRAARRSRRAGGCRGRRADRATARCPCRSGHAGIVSCTTSGEHRRGPRLPTSPTGQRRRPRSRVRQPRLAQLVHGLVVAGRRSGHDGASSPPASPLHVAAAARAQRHATPTACRKRYSVLASANPTSPHKAGGVAHRSAPATGGRGGRAVSLRWWRARPRGHSVRPVALRRALRGGRRQPRPNRPGSPPTSLSATSRWYR